MVTLSDIKNNKKIKTLIDSANAALEAIGYTDHGPRHVGYVSKVTHDILTRLGYPERTCELGAIAGWVHDVGNLVNRHNHGAIGATILFPILSEMGMELEEVCRICTAVGSHEEASANVVSELSAALIIADKIDAHRTRVRKGKYDAYDIHDRVNYAIQKTRLYVDPQASNIRFEFTMDKSSSLLEFMQIYMTRMLICEKAARFLTCSFSMVVNGMQINNFECGDTRPLPQASAPPARGKMVHQWPDTAAPETM